MLLKGIFLSLGKGDVWEQSHKLHDHIVVVTVLTYVSTLWSLQRKIIAQWSISQAFSPIVKQNTIMHKWFNNSELPDNVGIQTGVKFMLTNIHRRIYHILLHWSEEHQELVFLPCSWKHKSFRKPGDKSTLSYCITILFKVCWEYI